MASRCAALRESAPYLRVCLREQRNLASLPLRPELLRQHLHLPEELRCPLKAPAAGEHNREEFAAPKECGLVLKLNGKPEHFTFMSYGLCQPSLAQSGPADAVRHPENLSELTAAAREGQCLREESVSLLEVVVP